MAHGLFEWWRAITLEAICSFTHISEEKEMWVEGAYDCWWWAQSNPWSLYSHHTTLMTSFNLTLFIANAFQNHQLQAPSLNNRFMDIISYLSSLLRYVISTPILTSKTEVLASLLTHIWSFCLIVFSFLLAAIFSLNCSCPKSCSHLRFYSFTPF